MTRIKNFLVKTDSKGPLGFDEELEGSMEEWKL